MSHNIKLLNKFHNKIRKKTKRVILQQNDTLHSLTAPAEIIYWPDGNIKSETWYREGLIHRDNEPAITTYYESTTNSTLRSHSYWKNGNVHRDDGPAVIYYDMSTCGISYVRWHINGNHINPPYTKWPLPYEQQIEMKLKYG